MDMAPARELKVGRILEETFDRIETNAVPAAIFVVALTLANGAIAWFGQDYTSITQEVAKQGVTLIVSIIAAYLLFDAMLKRAGFVSRDAADWFLPYAALTIVHSLAVGIGFILIIFPGLYFMARWSIAQPMLIARRLGVFTALKQSWERTKGSEFAILLVFAGLLVIPIGLALATGGMGGPGAPPPTLLALAVSQLISSATSMIGIAMGVGLYKLLVVDHEGAMSAA